MTTADLFEKHADHNILATQSLNRQQFQAAMIEFLDDLTKRTRETDSCRNRFKLLVNTLHEAKGEEIREYL